MEDPTEEQKNDGGTSILNAYASMLSWLFFATASLVAITSLTTLLLWNRGSNPAFLPFVALSGAIGGFISSLSRLYSLENLPALLLHRDFKQVPNRYVLIYSFIPPLVGVIASVVVYVSVAGGVIDGDLFAKFKCPPGCKCDNGIKGLMLYSPEGVTDYAKALVWGFTSGFSERLLPATIESLDRTISRKPI